jgi:hypothetical protein
MQRNAYDFIKRAVKISLPAIIQGIWIAGQSMRKGKVTGGLAKRLK